MESIQDSIDKTLKKETEKERKSSHKWKPSAFGRCYRYQYWLRKDEPITNPPDARILRVFKAGSLFHDFVQELVLKETQAQKEVLIEIDDIKGYADIVNDEEVVDIKSQHSQSFWYRKKEESNIREKLYPNWLQDMWYCQQLNKKRGRLVFVSKDDLCIQEYFQENDNYWREKVDEEIGTLRHYWNTEMFPLAQPRAYKDNKTGKFKECDYCSFKNKCYDIEKNKELK